MTKDLTSQLFFNFCHALFWFFTQVKTLTSPSYCPCWLSCAKPRTIRISLKVWRKWLWMDCRPRRSWQVGLLLLFVDINVLHGPCIRGNVITRLCAVYKSGSKARTIVSLICTFVFIFFTIYCILFLILCTASGKMQVLDKLLSKLYAKGHRVVLFSQYTRTLDM